MKSILIGDNGENLHGCHNDVILFYNYFFKHNIPLFFYNNISFDIISKNIKNKSTIYFYFSGHSMKNGKIKIDNNQYSSKYILSFLNNHKKNINIVFIIDSCYSEKFITNTKYKYINSVKYLLSSSHNQTSKEIIVDYNEKYYQIYKVKNITSNKLVHSIFSYNLCKLLYKYDFNINKIKNHPIWNIINKKYQQQFIYFEN